MKVTSPVVTLQMPTENRINQQKLNSLLADMKGKKCFRSWDGVPPAIFFELGNPIDKGRRQGEFSLCIMGALWKIQKDQKTIARPNLEKEQVIGAIKLFESEVLEQIEICKLPEDIIRFSNGLKITIDRNDSYEWSIVTPTQEVIFTSNNFNFIK